MKNKIQHLRDHLFEQIEAIKEAQGKEQLEAELAKGRGITELSKVIVDSARLEVDAMKVLEGRTEGTGFMQLTAMNDAAPALPRPPVRN